MWQRNLIEQAKHSWEIRVESDTGALRLAVDALGMVALCKLRQTPRAGKSQRLSPLLHWVRAHLRRRPSGIDYIRVMRHLRGIRQFELDDLVIHLEQPALSGPECAECRQPEYPIDNDVCLRCWERLVGREALLKE